MPERFDAIVVGAGPAGSAAALVMARAGLNVALLERGEYPGAKNLFGGAFYPGNTMTDLVPEFWREAPVERYITRRTITFMTPRQTFSIDFRDANFGEPPYNGFTIMRGKFDRWFAGKAVEAGALLIAETAAVDIIKDDGRVVGVRTGRPDGDIYADVVIAADGVNSFVARKAGLSRRTDYDEHNPTELDPHQVNVAAKEVIALPEAVIRERFNVAGNEGVANEVVGSCTDGVEGGGFIYTNKDSVSVGVLAKLSGLSRQKISIADLMEGFKEHPYVKELVKGGAIKEYGGHMVPEAGLAMAPQIYDGGILVTGDAAGFVLATGVLLEGVNFAIASGKAAAETVVRAKQAGDFSRESMAHYQSLLESSFVLQDLKTFKGMTSLLENRRMYNAYPNLVCSLAERFFRVDGQPRRKVMGLARDELKQEGLSLWQLIGDGLKAGRAML